MGVDIIENNGPDNLRNVLNAKLRRSTEVSIAVAFVTQAGLANVLQPLRDVASVGRVKFLTGLYQRFTEPQALTSLLNLQTELGEKFQVRLSTEPMFHRKLYLLSTGKRSTAVIGSSNLTHEGLQNSGELNMIASFPRHSAIIKRISWAFNEDWEHRSTPLLAEQIGKYEEARPVEPKEESFTRSQLSDILGVASGHQETVKGNEYKRVWRDSVSQNVKQRTIEIISETTDWDEKHYWWFCYGGPNPYEIGDRIFLFCFLERRVRLVEVMAVTRNTVTPDGRHFIAYKPVYRVTRKFSKKMWLALKEEKITIRNARMRKKLGIEAVQRLIGIARSH